MSWTATILVVVVLTQCYLTVSSTLTYSQRISSAYRMKLRSDHKNTKAFKNTNAFFNSQDSSVKYKTKYFFSYVDNLSFTSDKKFAIKYLINDTFYKPGGPIFFYTGNEGQIEAFAENTLFMWENAPKFKALIIFAEHRYYGSSMPFGNHSYDNATMLAFLTAEQALSDYATFLEKLPVYEPYVNMVSSPVIAFGGSYGGMLSAWIRIKYPHIVYASIAASAPVLLFVNYTSCYSFLEKTSGAYQTFSKNCPKNIRNSWTVMNKYGASDSGLAKLSSVFKTCRPLKNTNDVNILKAWLADMYVTIAMMNYPYPTNFVAPLPGWPVGKVCQHLNVSLTNDDALLSAISAAAAIYYNYTGDAKCLDFGSQSNFDSSSSSLDSGGWNIQSCNEMVMPDSCSDGVNDMFEPTGDFDMQQYIKNCQKQFGITPRPSWIMTEFGSVLDLASCSNILYSNGALDPWIAGAVRQFTDKTCASFVMPSGAHHIDLRGSNPLDPIDVQQARQLEVEAIQMWIDSFHEKQEKRINKHNDLI